MFLNVLECCGMFWNFLNVGIFLNVLEMVWQ